MIHGILPYMKCHQLSNLKGCQQKDSGIYMTRFDHTVLIRPYLPLAISTTTRNTGTDPCIISSSVSSTNFYSPVSVAFFHISSCIVTKNLWKLWSGRPQPSFMQQDKQLNSHAYTIFITSIQIKL